MRREYTIEPFAPLQPWEDLRSYGLRALGYVLAHGHTSALSDEDLRLADHFYPIAVSRPDLSTAVLDRLTAVRHIVLQAIKHRQEIAEREAAGGELASGALKGGGQPGHGARLQPQPIVQPPAGALARADFF